MALPACFHLADAVFPRVRAVAARRLVADGWSQGRAAQALGVTQAMVSKYLAAPPAPADPLVERLADEAIAELAAPRAPGATSAWCATLADAAGPDGDALADLLAAERLLVAAPPLALVPQVGLNLARARPDARDAAGVLSFPGRLVEAGDRLLRPAAPAWGASGHLARCLLELRRRDDGVLAIANVRGGPSVRKAAAQLGAGPVADLEHPKRADPEAAFRAAAAARPDALLLHDPGAFGVEPCLYLAGPDAATVARRILQLETLVNP